MSKENLNSEYHQKNIVDFLRKHHGKEQWVTVSGRELRGSSDISFWCGLIEIEHLDNAYRRYEWDIHCNSGYPGFEGFGDNYTYKPCLIDDYLHPLLYYREFYGVKPDYVELSQEFILFNNLYYDRSSNSFWAMYDDGLSEEAVRIRHDNCFVEIKLKFLIKFITAKQMALLLFFDSRWRIDGTLSDFGLQEYHEEKKDESLFYGMWGGEMNMPKEVFSVIMGKKIISPQAIEKCGIWPYEKERSYEEYIIGIDEMGNEIKHTCDPDKLSNYFGANPGAPMYLTPVFFKREVLQKYISKPELYEVRDGRLDCKQLWGIEIDNHHKDCVSVYLGDLGRDLPEAEQEYWKSFNIVGEGRISDVALARDFFCVPAESNMADHIFISDYIQLRKRWSEIYGWDLYLPLAEEDQYNLTQLRIPLTDNHIEFDQLVLSLTKVLIDSLNEKELRKRTQNIEENDKGISKLEKWLASKEAEGYETHIQFLRDLQDLRSTGTGHRKGKSYNKTVERIGIENRSLIDAFELLLEKADNYIEYLIASFLTIE